jgi:hypothetical protein
VTVHEGQVARIDVIDTWNMTVEPFGRDHQGAVTVTLPARPYMAIRVIVIG